MCDCDFIDGPSAFRRITRRAAKPHRCHECRRPIVVGERYEYASGIWDGRPLSFKTCSRCALLRAAHAIAESRVGEDGCDAPFGDLLATIAECVRDGGVDRGYVFAFQQARRELLATA